MTQEELISLGFTKVNYFDGDGIEEISDESKEGAEDIHNYRKVFGDVSLESTYSHVSYHNNWGVYFGGHLMGEYGKVFYTEDFNLASSLINVLSGFSLIDYVEPELPEIIYYIGGTYPDIE